MARLKLPTEIKKANGTWRKDRDPAHPISHNPLDRTQLPKSCPEYITDPRAQKFYFDTISILFSAGIMYEITISQVAQYAYHFQRWLNAVSELAELGSTYFDPKRGTYVRHPANYDLRDAEQAMRVFERSYGLSASAAAAIDLPQDDDEDKPKKGKTANGDIWGL